MKMELPEIRPEERTPLVEALLAIIRELLDRNQQLEETVLQLRDEIAVLKGQKPRPKIKPSSLESATPPSQQEGSKKEKPDKRSGSEKRSKNAELTNKIFEQIQTAFYEDVAVFSAQQRSLDLVADPPQVDINADTGVIQARRILDRLHDEEQAALHASAAE